MTTLLLLLGGWCVLSVATVAAIARAATQRERGCGGRRYEDASARLRIGPAANLRGWRPDANQRGVLARVHDDHVLVLHTCSCCGLAEDLVLEHRRAG